MDELEVDLGGDWCARCGEDGPRHPDGPKFLFRRFTHPIEDADGTVWTHWAPCPVNGDPVLLKTLVSPGAVNGSPPPGQTAP